MNILKTLAVSAVLASTTFAATTTKIKNTSTRSMNRSSFEKFKKDYDLIYTTRIRGASLSEPSADQPIADSGSSWGNNQLRHRFDFKHVLSSGDKILFRNDIYNNANNKSTMDNPTLGYEHSFGKLWTRFSSDVIVKNEDRTRGLVANPGWLGAYSINITDKFSTAFYPWMGLDLFDRDNGARSAYIGNEIDLYYKFNNSLTGQFRYELEYYQAAEQNAVTEMVFSYSQVTAGLNVQVNEKMSFFPGLVSPVKKINADTTTLYGEFSYSFF